MYYYDALSHTLVMYSEPEITAEEPSSSIVVVLNVKRLGPDFVSLFNLKNKKYLSAVFSITYISQKITPALCGT